MNLTLFLGLLAAVGTFVASRAPTEDELVTSFHKAQRFYAEGAYDQAIEEYATVSEVRSKVLDTRDIEVSVGEENFPLGEAAAYQIGNAHYKFYQDYDRFAEEARNAKKKIEFRALADTSLARATAAFRRVAETATNEVLRVQAHGRLIDIHFSVKDYSQVVVAAQEMIAAYPNHPQTIEAYYNTGWAHYETQNYSRAIESFEILLERFSAGYQADRSLFQIGECLQEQGEYLRAIEHYRLLVERQRIEDLTEDELQQIKREKLAGLVDETALELAAKAEIRVGTCYTKLGRFEEGLKAYRRVITLFSTERQLVEEAYLRMADLYQEQGDLDASLRTYREAIDESSDRTLKASIQYALAERLFGQGFYERAVREYRIYLQGYSDIANTVGYSEGRVRYRIGSSYQQLGQQRLQADDSAGGVAWVERAIAQYDTLSTNLQSPYLLDAQFNRALAYQSLGTDMDAQRAQAEYETVIREDQDANYTQRSLVQLAEILFERQQYGAAAARAEQLLDSYPGSDYIDEAYMRLALSRQAENDLARAGEAFLKIPADSPYFARARLGAGHVFLGQRKFATASRVLEEGFAQAKDGAQIGGYHYLLGQAYSNQATYQRAVEHYTKALDFPASQELEEAIRLGRASAAFAVENYTLGQEDLRWIVDNVKDPERVRFAQDNLAFSYLKQNRGGDAIQVLDEMIAKADTPEEQANLLNRMLGLQYESDNYPETVRLARRFLALEFSAAPGSGLSGTKEKTYFILGDALMRLQRGAQAVETFNQALRLYPASPFALDMRLTLGAYYFGEGDLERAKEVFTELAKADLNPNQALLVSFYLANSHYSLREFKEARGLFQQLLQDHPNARELPDMLFGLAESHYQLGGYADAIVYYQRLLERFANETASDDAQYNMAWCLIELKREEEAMQAFSTLLERYPDSDFAASAQFTFGDHAYNRGDYQEALDAYLRVQQNYPKAEITEQVPRLVAELKEAIAYNYYEKGIALMDSAEATKQDQYYQQAVQIFQDVVEDYPGTESEIGALSNMGVCLEGLGEWKNAVSAYDQVILMFEEKKANRDAFQFAKSHRDWIVSTRL